MKIYYYLFSTTEIEADFCKVWIVPTYLKSKGFELYTIYANYNKDTWENNKSNVTFSKNFSLLNAYNTTHRATTAAKTVGAI